MRSVVQAKTVPMALALFTAMVLVGCSRGSIPPAAPATVPATVPTPLAPPLATTPSVPPEAQAIDAALAGAKAFNAGAAAGLAGVAPAERRIRDLTQDGLALAERARGGAESERSGLARRMETARKSLEAAHDDLTRGLATFQAGAAAQAVAVEAAIGQCAASPETGLYPSCASLQAEKVLMTQTVAATTARYDAAEATYRQSRTRMDEAAAVIALGG